MLVMILISLASLLCHKGEEHLLDTRIATDTNEFPDSIRRGFDATENLQGDDGFISRGW